MNPPAPSPPHNIEAEQALLGLILVNSEAFSYVAPAGLAPAHFYEPLHGALYAEMLRQHGLGQRPTPITLKQTFPAIDVAGMKLPQYLARLAAEATTMINAGDYAGHIKSLALTRELIEVGHSLQHAQHDHYAPDEALKLALDRFDQVRLELPRRTNQGGPLEATASLTIERMAQLLSGQLPAMGVPTRLKEFDHMTGGFRPGELWILAGRPGMGKSTIVSSLALQMAIGSTDPKSGEVTQHGVALFCMEMSEIQLGNRFLTDLAFKPQLSCTCRSLSPTSHDHRDTCPQHRIAYSRVLQGRISDAEAERLALAARECSNVPMYIEYDAPLSVGDIVAKIRKAARWLERTHKIKLGIVIIDYLKFIKASERYAGRKVDEIGEITGALKMAAKDLGIPIVLLHQLNRDVEKRADKHPELADLRDSGEIEQDADGVIFAYREVYYLLNDPKLNTDAEMQARAQACWNLLDLGIAKQRMGPTGLITVECYADCSAVRDRDPVRDLNPTHPNHPDRADRPVFDQTSAGLREAMGQKEPF